MNDGDLPSSPPLSSDNVENRQLEGNVNQAGAGSLPGGGPTGRVDINVGTISGGANDASSSHPQHPVHPMSMYPHMNPMMMPPEGYAMPPIIPGYPPGSDFYHQPYPHHPLAHPPPQYPYPPMHTPYTNPYFHQQVQQQVMMPESEVTSYSQATSTAAFGKAKKAGTGKRPRGRPKGSTNKGKPKRPLSAYNLFFKEERARILQSIPGEHDVESDRKPSASGEAKEKKKPHGKISFEKLAKMIASRWQALSQEELQPYAKRAKVEADRYKKELEACKAKEEAVSIKEQKTKDNRTQANEYETAEHIYFPTTHHPASTYPPIAPGSMVLSTMPPHAPLSHPTQPIGHSIQEQSQTESSAHAKARLMSDVDHGNDDPSVPGWAPPHISPIRFGNPAHNPQPYSQNPTVVRIGVQSETSDTPSTKPGEKVSVMGHAIDGPKSFVLGPSGYAPAANQVNDPSFSNIFHDAGAAFFDSPTNSESGDKRDHKMQKDD